MSLGPTCSPFFNFKNHHLEMHFFLRKRWLRNYLSLGPTCWNFLVSKNQHLEIIISSKLPISFRKLSGFFPGPYADHIQALKLQNKSLKTRFFPVFSKMDLVRRAHTRSSRAHTSFWLKIKALKAFFLSFLENGSRAQSTYKAKQTTYKLSIENKS